MMKFSLGFNNIEASMRMGQMSEPIVCSMFSKPAVKHSRNSIHAIVETVSTSAEVPSLRRCRWWWWWKWGQPPLPLLGASPIAALLGCAGGAGAWG
jgi:hypothetical protein